MMRLVKNLSDMVITLVPSEENEDWGKGYSRH